MTPEECRYLLECGGNPLELSIAKWADIVNGSGIDMGSDNCALCLNAEITCEKCKVMVFTGKSECCSTPYGEWYSHVMAHRDRSYFHTGCDRCREIAIKELRFLESLRDIK